jgi:antitoxin (DNA-binding transcriptional repressor) of toxin-antitoxin stability system
MNTKISLKEKIVGFKDFRLNASKYIDALSKGQSFLVIKRSRPAFRMEPVDEVWETVGDFTTLSGGGISANKLLDALK